MTTPSTPASGPARAPRLRRLLALTAACALALTVAACGSDDEESAGGTSGGEPYKIGILAPTTGSVSSDGEDMVNATKLAVEEINAAGGIDGRKVETVVADDACEAQQGVQAAQKLVQEKVIAVVGGFCSAATLPAIEVFERSGNLPFVVSVSSNPDVTDPGRKNIVRIIGRDDQEAPAEATYLRDVLKSEKVAIVHDNTEFAVSVAKQARSLIEKQGTPEIVYYDAIKPGGNDYRAMLERVKREGADTLFYTGFHPEFGPIARQWGSLGFDYRLLGGASTINQNVIKLAPKAAADEKFSIVTYPTAVLLEGEQAEKFRADYKKLSGNDPGSYGVFQYDGMQVLFEALKAAPDKTDADSLNARLREVKHSGVTGDIAFDEKGDRSAFPFLAVRSVDDSFAPSWSISPAGSWTEGGL